MTQHLRPDDHRLSWQGAVSFEDTSGWRMPWRIPHDRIGLYPPDALRERAAMPAGVRISCHTDTEFLAGHVEPVEECGRHRPVLQRPFPRFGGALGAELLPLRWTARRR